MSQLIKIWNTKNKKLQKKLKKLSIEPEEDDISLRIQVANLEKITLENNIVKNPNFKNITSLSDIINFQTKRKNINLAKKLIDNLIIGDGYLNLTFEGKNLPLDAYNNNSSYYNLNTKEFVNITISTLRYVKDTVKWQINTLSDTQERHIISNASKGNSLRICGSDKIDDFVKFKNENKKIIIMWHLINYIYYGWYWKEVRHKGKNQFVYLENFENRQPDEEWFENAYKNFIDKHT